MTRCHDATIMTLVTKETVMVTTGCTGNADSEMTTHNDIARCTGWQRLKHHCQRLGVKHLLDMDFQADRWPLMEKDISGVGGRWSSFCSSILYLLSCKLYLSLIVKNSLTRPSLSQLDNLTIQGLTGNIVFNVFKTCPPRLLDTSGHLEFQVLYCHGFEISVIFKQHCRSSQAEGQRSNTSLSRMMASA